MTLRLVDWLPRSHGTTSLRPASAAGDRLETGEQHTLEI